MIAVKTLTFILSSVYFAATKQVSSEGVAQNYQVLNRSTRANRRVDEDACGTTNELFSDLGAASRKINQLACQYRQLRRDSNKRGNDFNALIYFINEIGTNINAAKSHIFANQEKIRQLQNKSREENFPVNLLSVETLNSTVRIQQDHIQALNTRIAELEAQLNFTNEVLQTLSNGTNSMNNVAEAWKSKMDENIGKYSVLIESNKLAIDSLKSKLSNHASSWFNAPNGYQYYLSRNAFRVNSYVRSRRYCQNHGADLAFVGMRNSDVYRFIGVNLIGPSRHQCVWIGLTKRGNNWVWMDGTNVNLYWRNWASSTQRSVNSRNCGIIRAGMWMGESCTSQRRLCSFLCERKVF